MTDESDADIELTAEEITRFRKIAKEQRKVGSSIRYERRLADGSHIQVQMNGATPEQVALIHWLQAEEAWKAQEEWRKKEIKQELKRQQQKQKELDKRNKLKAEHEALLNDPSITGFRRDMLLRHAPVDPYTHFDTVLRCRSCYGTDYDPERLVFPCNEYVFTSEWTPDDDGTD